MPDYRDKLAGPDFELDRVEHARAARVAETDVLNSDECRTCTHLGRRGLFERVGPGNVLMNGSHDARVGSRDRVVSLLDAFRLRVDAEQFECVAQPRWTHAACSQQLRAREDFKRRTVCRDFALAQNDNPVGGAQLFRLMLDYDQAQALRAELCDQREDFRPALWIEIGGRFVEHD